MPPKKRQRERDESEAPAAKRQHSGASGVALSWGQNCMGQVGVGLDTSERKKPTLLNKGALEGITVVQAVAGGMHCAVLSDSGRVFTWGCNDQKALGRIATDDDSAVPGLAGGLDGIHIIQVSAGDSHTVALAADGRVFATGCFRDSNGILGFSEQVEEQATFTQIYPPSGAVLGPGGGDSTVRPAKMQLVAPATHVASGADHVAILTSAASPRAQLWTLGCPGQGQLGRVPERFTERDSLRDYKGTPAGVQKRRATVAALSRFLRPQIVPSKIFRKPLTNVFCGSFSTQVVDVDGRVFGTGLNNFSQLGLASAATILFAFHATPLWSGLRVHQLALSAHHTLALAADATATATTGALGAASVWCLGRGSEGQLGLPKAAFAAGAEEVSRPTLVPGLVGLPVVSVAVGSSVSFAVLADGSAMAWGFGENLQLGNGDSEDQYEPIVLTGQQLVDKAVVMISAGGQHSVAVAVPKPAPPASA